jgi:lactate permease
MIATLGLLPCAAVVVAVLVFRRSAVAASAIALTVALALWILGVFSPFELAHLERGLADSSVLTLLVGLVILGGLLFVEVSARGGALQAIDAVLKVLSLTPGRAVILVTIGIGVMLESLTGYGVSMLVTLPLLLRLVSRRRAITLALIGMSLMPWGALSVSALLGAELARLPVDVLANAILTTSGPVAFVLPLLCIAMVPNTTRADALFGVAAGAVLAGGIFATSRLVGVEVAGVGGGAAVIVLCVLIGAPSSRFVKVVLARPLWPYALLIGAIVLQKLIGPYLSLWGVAPTISTERVSFFVLTSPAIALVSASLLSLALARQPTGQHPPLVRHVALRSWRAFVSLLLFLMTARVLMEIGAVGALAGMLSQLGMYPAIGIVTLLGGLGAYVTGSGATANALFMPSATATGESLDAVALFAALQHSGAGHMAMASLPVIALLLAALPNRQPNDERIAVTTGIGLAAVWLAMVMTSGWVQVS